MNLFREKYSNVTIKVLTEHRLNPVPTCNTDHEADSKIPSIKH